jgi:hypothetical protein
LYERYNFKQEVRFFTDFMQSQMQQKYNQAFVPHAHIRPDDFVFYNKGRELWRMEPQFKENLEDVIRFQLEACDLLQGFQLYVDTNSGFGSLSMNIVEYFLKDEAPKAPVFLYSLHNNIEFKVGSSLTEEESTNMETRA